LTRKEHGIPPQPYRFFEKIHEHVLAKDQGIVALAAHGGKVVAGAVFFHFGNKVIYKFGASDRTSKHLAANHLVMWNAIKRYNQKGYEHLCFGRTEHENKGLRLYKTGWGTREEVINYVKVDVETGRILPSKTNSSGLIKRMYKKVPIGISTIVGSVIYRHVG
jgi:lipid II:glycine glycyltransferase (peptidoglycan interpeptide bridge formation enzyme)